MAANLVSGLISLGFTAVKRKKFINYQIKQRVLGSINCNKINLLCLYYYFRWTPVVGLGVDDWIGGVPSRLISDHLQMPMLKLF